jgi:peptidoglycan/LPS O-acetylase OafA/YrhL
MDYRREIDGLRAVAVLPVIFFHAGFDGFSGGFVGVDVFFVISGYLITSLIYSEIQAGTFTLVHFYERRARRLLPALFVVLTCCLPFAWMWLLPQDMKSFSQSLVAVSFFASNILFWFTSGYFDTTAELKPLLHTWSLAVEEQYYLLFPICVMIIWQLGKRWVISLFVAAFIVSLALAQWAPFVKPTTAFFLLPTRVWELLLGSFAAFYFAPSQIVYRRHKHISAGCSLIGLLLIFYAFLVFDRRTPHPSLYTLVPTVGTVLIILFAAPDNFVGKLLGNRFLVWIGLISYSAYLWHQPLFAFARHGSLDELNNLSLGLLVIASLFLAFLTWKYIETPFRNRNIFSSKKLFCYSLAGIIIFLLIGLIGHSTNGIFLKALRSSEYISITNYSNYLNGKSEENYWRQGCFNLFEGVDFFQKNNCEQLECKPQADCESKTKVFLIGDSHAAYLSLYLRGYLQDRGYNLSQYMAAYCDPLSLRYNSLRCRQINSFVLNRISDVKPEYVILFAQYAGRDQSSEYGEQTSYDEFIRLKTVELKSLGVKKIIIMGQIPTWQPSLPAVLLKRFTLTGQPIGERTFIGLNQESLNWDLKLRAITWPPDVHYLSLKDLLCNNLGCLTLTGNDLSSQLLVFDYGHLTLSGAKFVTESILSPLFDK